MQTKLEVKIQAREDQRSKRSERNERLRSTWDVSARLSSRPGKAPPKDGPKNKLMARTARGSAVTEDHLSIGTVNATRLPHQTIIKRDFHSQHAH